MQSIKFKFGLSTWDFVLLISGISLLIFLSFRIVKSRKLITEDLTNSEEEEDQDQDPEQEKNTLVIPTVKGKAVSDFYKKVVDTLPDMDKDLQMFITAQAMHETGIFTSPLFLQDNNAFGMNFPRVRSTTAVSITPNGFAHYDSVEDSIEDLGLYFKAREYPSSFVSVVEYVNYLKGKGYFEAPLKTYSNAVSKHLQTVKMYAN